MLVLLIVLAFGTAIYMGIRNPYQTPSRPARRADAEHHAAAGAAARRCPGATPADLFEHSPAAQFRTGADGVTLPAVRRTAHFSESQVLSALTAAKDYVVASSLDPAVLTGGAPRGPVRILLDPAQQSQFDQSIERPRNDGRHAATGWMVRFDPAKAALADRRDAGQRHPRRRRRPARTRWRSTADHVFVYAVRAAGAGDGARGGRDALLAVHRAARGALPASSARTCADQQLSVRAGRRCGRAAGLLRRRVRRAGPLLAGETAKDDGQAGTDPYARGRVARPRCAVCCRRASAEPGA